MEPDPGEEDLRTANYARRTTHAFVCAGARMCACVYVYAGAGMDVAAHAFVHVHVLAVVYVFVCLRVYACA